MVKKIKKKLIKAESVELMSKQTQEYTLWKATLVSEQIKDSPIHIKMRYLLAGIELGLLPQTAMPLCYISASEMDTWLNDSANAEIFIQALAFAEAKLEIVLYSAATCDPSYALLILEKRNSERWQSVDKTKFQEGVKAGFTFSEMLRKKKDKTLAMKPEFDVTIG